MNKKRLQMVIDAVQNHPDEQFDMCEWDCGTAQCAIGSFCKAHPRAGLKITTTYPKYKRLTDFYAVASYLGISIDEAHHLFAYDKYTKANKPEVLSRLRIYLNTH